MIRAGIRITVLAYWLDIQHVFAPVDWSALHWDLLSICPGVLHVAVFAEVDYVRIQRVTMYTKTNHTSGKTTFF